MTKLLTYDEFKEEVARHYSNSDGYDKGRFVDASFYPNMIYYQWICTNIETLETLMIKYTNISRKNNCLWEIVSSVQLNELR